MEILHTRKNERGSFTIMGGERLIGELTYSIEGDKTMVIQHTGVEDAFREQGMGQALVEAAVRVAEESGMEVKPVCPFAKWVLEEGHAEDNGAADQEGGGSKVIQAEPPLQIHGQADEEEENKTEAENANHENNEEPEPAESVTSENPGEDADASEHSEKKDSPNEEKNQQDMAANEPEKNEEIIKNNNNMENEKLPKEEPTEGHPPAESGNNSEAVVNADERTVPPGDDHKETPQKEMEQRNPGSEEEAQEPGADGTVAGGEKKEGVEEKEGATAGDTSSDEQSAESTRKNQLEDSGDTLKPEEFTEMSPKPDEDEIYADGAKPQDDDAK